MKDASKLIRRTNISLVRQTFMAAMAAAIFLGLLILFWVPPADLPLATCLFRSLTGHSCMTCGMTRSLHALLHGEWRTSMHYHLFGPAVLIGALLFLFSCFREAIGGTKIEIPAGKNVLCRALMTVTFVWIVYWGIRLATEGGL